MSLGILINNPSASSDSMGSRIVAEILPHSHNMPTAAIAPQFPLSLSIAKNKMDGPGEMGMMGEHFDPSAVARPNEDGYESRSGSDNVDGASGDDQEANDDRSARRKKYHRHTPYQIQELEAFFKGCHHPDEKQRMELSKRLAMEPRQIKFWFQNRRTQMKTQMERHVNVILRQEHDKLRADNVMLREALKNPICNSCGGPAMPGQVSNYELQQLRVENARLKDELGRICILADKFFGRPLTSSASHLPPPSFNSSLDLAVGRNEFGAVTNIPGSITQAGLEFVEGPAVCLMKPPMTGMMGNEMPHRRNMIIELALAAMNELIKLAQADSPLWMRSLDGARDILNQEEYMTAFPPCIGMKPNGFVTEASRETSMVIVSSSVLIETLMDVNRWVEMFPAIVAKATVLDMLSSGLPGNKNDVLQVIRAEFQVLSPLVPVRQVNFIRFCKQHAEGVWAVVDVSIDGIPGLNGDASANCRRLPSGCIVQEMPNNCCKVTWIEHSEYDESAVHHLCQPLLSSGLGFGAQRWVADLRRQCESLAVLMSSTFSGQDHLGINPNARRSMLNLAHRMMYNFFSGVCASSLHKWDKLKDIGEDVRVLTRKNINDPGEPPGVVLCAATSVWVPVTRQRLFDFMRDARMRSEWDILSNNVPMQEMVHIAKGQGHGNCVSLLRANGMNSNDNGMLILQETWSDACGSVVVYAPVDVPAAGLLMNGGDSSSVALLPSGFTILPDGHFDLVGPNNCNGTIIKSEGNFNETGGCLLTVAFQILVNSLPSAKLTGESVETVNNLISCTIQKIKAAVQES